MTVRPWTLSTSYALANMRGNCVPLIVGKASFFDWILIFFSFHYWHRERAFSKSICWHSFQSCSWIKKLYIYLCNTAMPVFIKRFAAPNWQQVSLSCKSILTVNMTCAFNFIFKRLVSLVCNLALDLFVR